MADELEPLERRIDELRAEVRRAALAGDRDRVRELRSELSRVQREWDLAAERLAQSADRTDKVAARVPVMGANAAVMEGETFTGGPAFREDAATRQAAQLIPVREQVHQTLTLLGVPTGQRLVVTVHNALFGGALAPARLTSIRRDEERSFRAAPHSRHYYICAALSADLLAPTRGVLAVSTWPMSRRVIGPLSPRVNYLTAAIRVAENIQRAPQPGPTARRLLWRFATNIPGAWGGGRRGGTDHADAETVARAAHAELEVHADADASCRETAAARARKLLSEAEQLFGSKLRVIGLTGTA